MRGQGDDPSAGRLTTAVDGRMSTMVPEESKEANRMTVAPSSNEISAEELAQYDESMIDITKIPGYFSRKNKYKVGNVNDFVNKLRKAAVCERSFENDDPNNCGIHTVMQKFQRRIMILLKDEPLLKGDYLTHLEEINEYVMLQLH